MRRVLAADVLPSAVRATAVRRGRHRLSLRKARNAAWAAQVARRNASAMRAMDAYRAPDRLVNTDLAKRMTCFGGRAHRQRLATRRLQRDAKTPDGPSITGARKGIRSAA